MDIFEKMKLGIPIDIRTDEEYKTIARAEMERSRQICFEANQLSPNDNEKILIKLKDLFSDRIGHNSFITPTFMIDRAKNMTIGNNVFINHGLTSMSSGGITIEDDVMIGPDVALITANHNLKDIRVLEFKQITIKKGAWIGARAMIMPGVTIGEGAIIAGGAIVTKDVKEKTVVAGVPAKYLKDI